MSEKHGLTLKLAVAAAGLIAVTLGMLAIAGAQSNQFMAAQGIVTSPSPVAMQSPSFHNGFYFKICGEGAQGPAVSGTAENPAVVTRNHTPVVISLCTRNTNLEDITWEIGAADALNVTSGMPEGIAVTTEKDILTVPAYIGQLADFAHGKGDKNSFNVIFTADSSATLGKHYVAILVRHELGSGTSFVFGHTIVIDVQE